MVDLFDGFIEMMLSEIGLEYEAKENYYITQNPFMEDRNPSFVIYRDGWCKSYNGCINGKDILHISNVAKLLGFKSKYIEFVLSYEHIPTHLFNNLKDNILNGKSVDGFCYEVMNSNGIRKNDIVSNEYFFKVENETFNKRKKKVKSNISELDISRKGRIACEEYIKRRRINSNLIEPVSVCFDGKFSKYAIAIRYQDGFTKYRFIEGKFRYMCKGKFDKLLSVVVDDNDTCLVVEGEFEAISLDRLKGYDVYAMHNCNTITRACIEQLKSYERVIFVVDYDKYYEIKDKLESLVDNSEVIYKFNDDKSMDFNSYIVDNGKVALNEYVKKLIKE